MKLIGINRSVSSSYQTSCFNNDFLVRFTFLEKKEKNGGSPHRFDPAQSDNPKWERGGGAKCELF